MDVDILRSGRKRSAESRGPWHGRYEQFNKGLGEEMESEIADLISSTPHTKALITGGASCRTVSANEARPMT